MPPRPENRSPEGSPEPVANTTAEQMAKLQDEMRSAAAMAALTGGSNKDNEEFSEGGDQGGDLEGLGDDEWEAGRQKKAQDEADQLQYFLDQQAANNLNKADPFIPTRRKSSKTYSKKGKAKASSRPITPKLSPDSRRAGLKKLLKTDEEEWSDDEVEEEPINPYQTKGKAKKKLESLYRSLASSKRNPAKRQRSPNEFAVLKRSRVDPPLLQSSKNESAILKGRPFQPKAKITSTVDMPSYVVINKLRNSMYVPMWHFTQEGIIAGRARDANVSYAAGATLSKLLDTLGTNTKLIDHRKEDSQLIDHRKEDSQLSFQEMTSAFQIFKKVMAKVVAEADEEVKEWLLIEKLGFEAMWEMLQEHSFLHKEIGWPWLAKYVEKFRVEYYNSPHGRRPDPSEWSDDVWKLVKDEVDLERTTGKPTHAAPATTLRHRRRIHITIIRDPRITTGLLITTDPRMVVVTTDPRMPVAISKTLALEAISKVAGPFSKAPRPTNRGATVHALSAVQSSVTTSKPATGLPRVVTSMPSAMPGSSSAVLRMAPSSATDTTYLEGATSPLPTASLDSTSAPCVESLTTAARLVPSASPLKPEGFKLLIERYDLSHAFPNMVRDLEQGFDFGIPPVRATVVQKNHCSLQEDLMVLHGILLKEMEAGRVVGPFTKEKVEEMVGPFQTSPLGLVPKPGGKWRMIQDFSSPRRGEVAAINAYIDSDEFVCGWDGYVAMVDQVSVSVFLNHHPHHIRAQSSEQWLPSIIIICNSKSYDK
ncbi:hypothetical protein CF326_g8447 [Tilletia indica]|nr:hypothetical protein CF326_g8447 [Tilletia indica]